MKIKIIPTLIAENQKELEGRFNKVKSLASWLEVDIMDGKFVETKYNWFDFKLPKTHKYSAHLMVDDPMSWVESNYTKCDSVIANIERLSDVNKFIEFANKKRIKKGLALNPETPLKDVMPYIKSLDCVLILTINPGRYGAPFIPEAVKKIEALRKVFSGDIEADGCQNLTTIPKTVIAGANVIAVGSYIQNSTDPNIVMEQLKEVIKVSQTAQKP